MTDCIFCKIIKKEIPADFEYEGKSVIVFASIEPKAPVHLLIVPKAHVPHFAELSDKKIWDEMDDVAKQLIEKHNLTERGYRLTMNGGPAAQVKHLHMHLLGEVTADAQL